jgi:hypothetical protein
MSYNSIHIVVNRLFNGRHGKVWDRIDLNKLTRLFLDHLLLVEGQFGALQDVAITTASLSRSAGDLGVHASRGELVVKDRVQSSGLLARLELLLDLSGLLRQVLRGLFTVTTLLDSHLDTVVCLVPRLEGVGIDDHNSTLDQSLGTNKFVVRGIVGNIQHTDLSGARFGTPGEVSAIQTESAELGVASAATDLVDTRLTNLGHGGGAAQFELTLFAELCAASTGFPALVSSFACDTHGLLI